MASVQSLLIVGLLNVLFGRPQCGSYDSAVKIDGIACKYQDRMVRGLKSHLGFLYLEPILQ